MLESYKIMNQMAKACGVVLLPSTLLALTMVFAGAAANCQKTSIVLDGNSTGRVFDGIGAVSAGASSRLLIDYPEPQRSQILDYLFKPGYGAALQRLKVEIGGDTNSTDGSEPSHMRNPDDHDSSRGYEWWLMAEAHKRNPNIVLEILPWGAPAWVGEQRNSGRSLYTTKMAAYVAEFIKMAHRDYGLDISVAGVWNEVVYDPAYVKELHRRFKAEGLNTKIVCCDEYDGQGAGQWAIADDMLKDPELAKVVDFIGAHYPCYPSVGDKPTTTESARKSGKPLWSSEDQPNDGGVPTVSRDWPEGGRVLAHRYNQNYFEGAMTATEIWSPITSYYDNLSTPNSGLMYANTPWSGNYRVQSTIWVTAHTTQFTEPGWQYIDSASGNLQDKGSYVTLRSPDKKNWTVVLETIGATHPQAVHFKLAGGLTAVSVHIWQTGASRTLEHIANLPPLDGTFTFTLEPDSIYTLSTTTGQGRGTAEPPLPTAFPLPYADDFELSPLKHAPKYLADQDGAFEVQPCDGRPGRCLEQVITEIPVPWGALPDPFTLAGDSTWTDYSVSIDALFLSGSPAVLMGRIDNADFSQDAKARWPSGYLLRVKPDGAWEILSAAFKKPVVTLASGDTAIDRAKWHHLELRFNGSLIVALLDGVQLASVENTAHIHGMFALGTEWDRIQFDNLRVTQ